MSNGLHANDDQLELYALGRISGSDIDAIEDHLMVCDGCRSRLDSVETTIVAFREELIRREVAQQQPVADWFDWLRRPAFGLSIAAAVLAILVVFLVRSQSGAVAPLAMIQLTAMRGDMAAVPAARETRLTLQGIAASGPIDIQVVDAGGSEVLTTEAAADNGTVLVTVSRTLPAGSYFVRLAQSGMPIAEYGFRVLKR